MVSQLAATMVILALTIAIAVGVIGYITGFLGSAMQGQDVLQILPDSGIDPSTGQVCVHLLNRGSRAVLVSKVEVPGLGASAAGVIVLPATDRLVCVPLPAASTVSPGTKLLVKVYTKEGYVFASNVLVESFTGAAAAGSSSSSNTTTGSGSVTLSISSADSITVSFSGTIAFVPAESGTIVLVSGSVSFGVGEAMEIRASGDLGPGGETSEIIITGSGGSYQLSLSYIPNADIYKDNGNAHLASGTVKCLSPGSTSVCAPLTMSHADVTGTITVQVTHGNVLLTVNGAPVVDDTDFTGTITISGITSAPPTTIRFVPSSGQLVVDGVQATVSVSGS